MERLEIPTPLGPIWLWGKATGRPTLLFVSGVWSNADAFDHLPRVFPGIDVLRTHLPGNHCPPLLAPSIGVYAEALRVALRQAAPHNPLVIFGQSAGALVAMGVRAENLRGLLLVEPPIFSDHLWHLAQAAGPDLAPEDATLLWNLFGMRGLQVAAPRDYSALVRQLRVPTHVLVGDDPVLPSRATERPPSYVDDAARRLLASQPLVTLQTVAGAGHNVTAQAPLVVFEALVALTRRLAQRPAAEAAGGRQPAG